jgi:hypothetical protein
MPLLPMMPPMLFRCHAITLPRLRCHDAFAAAISFYFRCAAYAADTPRCCAISPLFTP